MILTYSLTFKPGLKKSLSHGMVILVQVTKRKFISSMTGYQLRPNTGLNSPYPYMGVQFDFLIKLIQAFIFRQ